MFRFNDATPQEILSYLNAQRVEIEKIATDADFGTVYQDLVSVNFGGNPWASAIQFNSMNDAGKVEFINGNSDDVPMADARMVSELRPAHMAGIGYGYGFAELNEARVNGFDLDAEKALAAKRVYEEFVDAATFTGATEKGVKGLVNQFGNGITRKNAGTSLTDVSSTAKIQGIITIVRNLIETTGNGRRASANTLLVPKAVATAWKGAYMPDNAGMTVYDFIRLTSGANGGEIVVQGLQELANAGATDGNNTNSGGVSGVNRLVAYKNDPTSVQLYIPMAHQFLPVFQSGPLRWDVPGVFRFAGIHVKRVADIAYHDVSGT